MRLSNEERARRLADRIAQQVQRGAGRGINMARIFLVSRIRETLSVKAPRVSVVNKKTGLIYYRALTPANKDAPPRTLSGALKASLTSEMLDPKTALIGSNARSLPSTKYPQGFPYPRYHEIVDPAHGLSGKHQYVSPTVEKYKKEIAQIINQSVKLFFAQ